ncbi:ADP-ribosylation factor-like protein 16 [Platysternon megacephalum]|uniref:ADP-ribosylation factor-like protein 16 n=1 Tax=Platysternon megacephalum TaxID=55544 RepID=A0A4D9DH14_9SAUR|nr:ADP-ribosylation factor-like protein 16 [Platysternon megacephalum]
MLLMYTAICKIHDIFHVFPQTRQDEIEFIFASECQTGFRHLYKITSILKESRYKRSCGGLPAPSDFKCAIKEELAITSGEWEVLGRHGSNVYLSHQKINMEIHITANMYDAAEMQEIVGNLETESPSLTHGVSLEVRFGATSRNLPKLYSFWVKLTPVQRASVRAVLHICPPLRTRYHSWATKAQWKAVGGG